MYTLDYETEAIGSRPDQYPPRPVGIGIKHNDQPGRYLGWGHPEGNNCTEQEAVNELIAVWNSGETLLFQNAKFDLDVAEVHHGLHLPEWSRVHDTQFLLYLYDPHARQLGLKPSAERILDWPPEERDLVQEWVMRHVHGARKSDWGAHICRAPGDLVGPYCVGDIDRTFALYEHLYPRIVEQGMEGAYDRERQLMPVLLQAERFGIRVDLPKLQADLEVYEAAFVDVSQRVYDAIGTTDINLDSPAQVGPALIEAGLADESKFARTEKTGKLSMAKDSLAGAVECPTLLGLLGYRGALKTCLGTFMRPWEGMAAGTGRIHTTWHQTRGEQEKGGTRTGRLSSANPNFTNVPNDLARTPPPDGLPALPLMREYLLPEQGHVWLKRDYSSQEVRALAHFEDGALMRQYMANPDLDPHQFAADLITDLTGNSLTRSDTKRIAFSILYGSGINALAADLGVEYHEAARFKELYLAAFPGVRDLSADIKLRGRQGLPVRTIGGRLIYAERGVNGRDFSYKLLNHLIQGSAADITKQGVINYARAGGAQLLAIVHDEINVSVPMDKAAHESEVLKECMADISIDVPLTSDYYVGRNWEDADQHKNGELT